MVVVVVVVDSWLCLFPKAAVLPFPRPPWLQPGPTPFSRLGPDLQILQVRSHISHIYKNLHFIQVIMKSKSTHYTIRAHSFLSHCRKRDVR